MLLRFDPGLRLSAAEQGLKGLCGRDHCGSGSVAERCLFLLHRRTGTQALGRDADPAGNPSTAHPYSFTDRKHLMQQVLQEQRRSRASLPSA